MNCQYKAHPCTFTSNPYIHLNLCSELFRISVLLSEYSFDSCRCNHRTTAHLDCYIPLGNLPHVEAHSWNHVFIELPTLKYGKDDAYRHRGGTTHHYGGHYIELTAITFTNVVFPEFWRPTNVSSISSFQKRLLNQSTIRLKKVNMSEGSTGHLPQ